jgi:hypothetical protein
MLGHGFALYIKMYKNKCIQLYEIPHKIFKLTVYKENIYKNIQLLSSNYIVFLSKILT